MDFASILSNETSVLTLSPGILETTADPGLTNVLLVGDSTVITSYLPDEQRYHRVLAQELKAAGPAAKFKIRNAADNGEFIARYLLSGAYERMRRATAGADIIVVRFGVNDEKRVNPAGFGMHLRKFLDLLAEDFPGTRLILETGVYMDPKHYSFDRNRALLPYWQTTRLIAAERRLPLCDVYLAMELATAAGNWDLRIRKTGVDGSRILDASQDAGRENDRSWFSDIHPNAAGTRVGARELARCLAETFRDRQPTGYLRRDRQTKTSDDYARLLNFSPDLLQENKNASWRIKATTQAISGLDDFQQAADFAQSP